jgi:hypothetical protein
LTPPPTGGFEKSFQYSSEEIEQQVPPGLGSPINFKRFSLPKDASTKDDSVLSFFSKGSDEDSQDTISSDLAESTIIWDTASSTSSLTDLSDSEGDDFSDCQPLDYFAALTFPQQCRPVEGPFNFLGLPLAVRKKIYALILTIPALISVRQNRTCTYNETNAYLFAESRQLLPGIAFALAQLVVDGTKFQYCRYRYANAAILRVSQKIHYEAKEVMYQGNDFDLANLNNETSPPADFKIPLFPRGYARLIRKMTVRAQSIYGFQYLIKHAGHEHLKNHYRGVETLTLILELDSIHKGYGRPLSRDIGEKWIAYVKRVHNILQMELFGCPGIFKSIPVWVNMRVLMTGDHYVDPGVDNQENAMDIDEDEDELKERHIKAAVPEAFELFKRGARK